MNLDNQDPKQDAGLSNPSVDPALDPNNAANGCFVCGASNPIGLGVKFRLEGDRCLAEFTIGGFEFFLQLLASHR